MNCSAERKILGKLLKLRDFSFTRRRHFFDEAAMDGTLSGEFGMERRRHVPALLHQHRVAVIAHKYMRVAAGLPNNRSANKHRLQRLTVTFKRYNPAVI